MNSYVAVAVVGYLLGSIPFGYLLVKLLRGEDVRRSGSGNIGATNVARTAPALGILTLVLDALKGTAAVLIARMLVNPGDDPFRAAAYAAFFAVIGHVFPIWLRFKGGKGVATGVGSFAALAPKAVLIAIAIFALLLLAFRYVSLGSIAGSAAFPVAAYYFHGDMQLGVLAAISSASLLIIAKHHQNIQRLIAGNENRLGAKAR